MYDEYDDGEGGGSSLGRKIALGVGVVAIAALGWFTFNWLTGDGGGGTASGGDQVSEGDSTSVTTAAPGAAVEASATTTPATEAPAGTDAATTVQSTAEVPGTAAPAPAPSAPAPTAAPGAPYATMPDGTPAPVVVIYDETSTRLTGALPDEATKQRLEDLAKANAKPGQENVDNQVTINPAVPNSVGVRVVELTSERFPDGSAEIQPLQAADIDRVVNVMNLLPNVTVQVIGHADQRGDEVTNYILSKQRADAVLNYLVAHGIDPARVASKAVGEEDLLSINDDDAALKLNRRTEFVFYGLLQP